ncbi:MAG: helix-turn-helix transcriptional regulator [Candidatus Omnitrophica bacterium]|nr:helix-turn-helix transcriptional regulator [Candidatus Omnitrophota bacterium]
MKPIRAKTHEEVLKRFLKDEESKRRYEEELNKLRIVHTLIDLRHKRGWTQTQFAHRLGVSQPFIAKIESGDFHNFGLETLVKLADALDSELEIRFRPRHSKAA